MWKRIFVTAFLSAAVLLPVQARKNFYSVNKIWGGDAYCAFTSLVEFKGRYYCAFREGEGHVFDSRGNAEGKIRVLVSRNGRKWRSVYLASKPGFDLRDPKLSVTSDGRLMVNMGGSIYRNKTLTGSIPQVCFSRDGKVFSEPQSVEFKDNDKHGHDWLWYMTWKDGKGYSVNYSSQAKLGLYSTEDGVSFEKVTDLAPSGNEVAIHFLPDGRMALLVRCDNEDSRGWWGTSEAPFADWTWKRLDFHIGGPDFVVDGNDIYAAGRFFTPHAKTAIHKGDASGNFDTKFLLPSGGDCSYPGDRKSVV